MSIEKEFIPYEQALALKELGFNEPCFAVYFGNGSNELFTINPSTSKELTKKMVELGHIPCPTFSQAFRFFREKYNIYASYGITNDYKEEENGFCISNFIDGKMNYLYTNWEVGTYEQAELECLRKLIEICKSK